MKYFGVVSMFLILLSSQGRNWLVKRCYEDFRVLDKHLHLCIYDRRFSKLCELPRFDTLKDTLEVAQFCFLFWLQILINGLRTMSQCGPDIWCYFF